MSDIMKVRDIETVTTEIKTIEQQVAKSAIYGFIEIGKRLVEAKEMVGHGNWGKYLEEKVRYSQQWATNLMNLYKEYGHSQESLFDNFANSKSFGNIDVTKHILLLGVPAEEREAFAQEHDAENATTRELQAAIRERDAANQTAEEAEARARELEKKLVDTTGQLDIAGDKLKVKEVEIKDLLTQAKAAEEKQAAAAKEVDRLAAEVKKAKAAEKDAKAALKKAKDNPEIPEAMMEEMRQQVAADAAAKATEELQKKLAEAKAVAAETEKREKEAKAQLAEAEKKARLSNGDLALVSAYLQGVQDQFKKMMNAIRNVEAADPEAGAKLRENVKAKLLPMLEKMLEG